MRAFWWLVLLIGIVGIASAAQVSGDVLHHSLVTVIVESPTRLAALHQYTNLDIVPGETQYRPRVVALPEDLAFLTAHGFAYEMVYQDVEQYYASRLVSPTLLMGGYKTYAEIQTAMDDLHTAHPAIATAKWSIGATLEGRQQWVMLITNLADSSQPKPEVFYNSLIHAREPEAMECNFYFMNWLTDNYGTDPMATYLVDNRRMYFLPCVNPDGYVYNQTTNPNGGGMWRKNRKPNGDGSYGVDCNRNFDAAWGIDNVGSSPTPGDETYRGTAPFSELETQHLRDFINSRHFVTEQDFHTYQDDILIPWGTSYYPPPNGNGLTPDDATFRMIADSMNYFIHSVNGVFYATGTPWEILYNTNGGSFDWEYGDASHQKIYALTTEVGNLSDGFWPPTNRIVPLAQENLPSLIFLARIAGPLQPCVVQPVANVSPPSITAHAAPGGTDTQTLQICNVGGCHLTWSVTYAQTSPALAVSTNMVALPVADFSDDPIVKDAPDEHHGSNPLDSQGGPDAFGYLWKDSNEPDGPVYSWVELVGLGTRMNFTGDDQTLNVTLPWAFPFYGNSYTTAHVSANGNIHFSADTVDYGNGYCIPSGRLPNAMLALFWDDLSPQNVNAPGGIYYYNDAANNRFIVQYDSIPHYSSTTGRYTCEAILYSSGRIVYQYQTLTGALNSCTIGIEDATGSVGLQVVCNGAYLTNNLAIEFHSVPNWLTFNGATNGSVDSAQCANITMNFAAGALDPGTYTGQVTVQTSDPAHNMVTVPVSFVVGQLAVPQEFAMAFDPDNNTLLFTWASTGASHYKVYSATSLDGPYDTLVGSSTTTSLSVPAPTDLMLFYHVVSSDQP